jgi:hypothetical protein
MPSWDDHTITVKDVNYVDAVESVRRAARKYNRSHVTVWDDLIWRCWAETGLDHRSDAELDKQPREVRAYYANTEMLRCMGLVGCNDAAHVLFLCREAHWAVVASMGLLMQDYEQ